MKHFKLLRISYDSCAPLGGLWCPLSVITGKVGKVCATSFYFIIIFDYYRTWLMHCSYLKYHYNSLYETSHQPYDTTYSAQVFPLLFCIKLELRRQTTHARAWILHFPFGFLGKAAESGNFDNFPHLESLIPLMHAPSLAVCVVLICLFPLDTLASSHPRSYQYVWITFQTKTLFADRSF